MKTDYKQLVESFNSLGGMDIPLIVLKSIDYTISSFNYPHSVYTCGGIASVYGTEITYTIKEHCCDGNCDPIEINKSALKKVLSRLFEKNEYSDLKLIENRNYKYLPMTIKVSDECDIIITQFMGSVDEAKDKKTRFIADIASAVDHINDEIKCINEKFDEFRANLQMLRKIQ